MEQVDIVILGAGAAGLMAAATAARRGRRVLVLDHARQAGEKILISGGGRCNFTNLHTDPDRFWSDNPRFCRSALARYTPQDFIDLVDRHAIAWHEKTLGQLFCDGSARQIVAMLLAECHAAGAAIRLQTKVTDVSRADRFHLQTDHGALESEALIIATGGLSIPKIGATGFGLDLARRFGLPVTTLRPALVPLLLDEQSRLSDLAGLSLPVTAQCGTTRFDEGMVVTHRGLSGPSILQISSVWRDGETVAIDLLPTEPADALCARKRTRPKAGLRGILADLVPQRLADAFLPPDLAARPIGDVPDRALAALETTLRNWRVRPTGTEGYAKAEVMLGGVATDALSQKTMAAKSVPGLYVVGEAVDVTGWLGGYNFQWAWASGVAAGQAA